MYFPFLLARGEEVEAILGTVCKYEDKKVIPILQPYAADEDETYFYKALKKAIKSLITSQKQFVLIIEDEDDLEKLIVTMDRDEFNKYCIYGFYNTSINIKKFSSEKQLAILHDEVIPDLEDSSNILYHILLSPQLSDFTKYSSKYPKEKIVVIEDGFNKQTTNEQYPPAECFKSSLASSYNELGVVGFGDYTILGRDSAPSSGGNMKYITHVIHLTNLLEKGLEVRHYLTTPREEPETSGRSKATLKKAYNDRKVFFYSSGIKMLEEKYIKGTTSLGSYKRMGILHHIDLIHSLI